MPKIRVLVATMVFSLLAILVEAPAAHCQNSATPPVDPANGPIAPGVNAVAPAAAASPVANPGQAALPKVGSARYSPVDGPLLAQRGELYAKFLLAKQHGFGISAYMTAFAAIESSVQSGVSEEELGDQLERLTTGFADQVKRSKILKIQKPAPPIAASSPSPTELQQASGGGGRRGGGIPNLNDGNIMETLKDKWFGGEIPDSIKKKIPAGFDPSMISTPEGQELLKKLNK